MTFIIDWLKRMLNPPRYYTVRPGDTLSGIANSYYGNPHKYPLIFDANRDKLSDPNKIQPGMNLLIPWD